MIRAYDFQFQQEGTKRDLSCQIQSDVFPDRLYFECNANTLPDAPLSSGNFALVSLLYPAMVLGEDLEIDAVVSPLLLYSAQHDLQSLLIDYRPELKRIKVSATSAKAIDISHQKNVVTGFSAGVDTFTTLNLYTADDVPECRRITSLTTFDLGAKGPVESTSELFDEMGDRLRGYATENGYNWHTVRSNLGAFFTAVGQGFQITHVIRNVAAALVFEDLFKCYLYSSTYPYRQINSDNHDIAFIEPMLLPLLSTETLRFESAGAGLSRAEKTKLVSEFPPARGMLDVCVDALAHRKDGEKINCSKCWKCCRTMVTLDIMGKLDDFEDVFDVEYYRANTEKMALTVFEGGLRGKPADREVIDLAHRRNFDLAIPKDQALRLKLLYGSKSAKSTLSRIPMLRSAYRKVRGRS